MEEINNERGKKGRRREENGEMITDTKREEEEGEVGKKDKK